jgi:hypothetical protein
VPDDKNEEHFLRTQNDYLGRPSDKGQVMQIGLAPADCPLPKGEMLFRPTLKNEEFRS